MTQEIAKNNVIAGGGGAIISKRDCFLWKFNFMWGVLMEKEKMGKKSKNIDNIGRILGKNWHKRKMQGLNSL